MWLKTARKPLCKTHAPFRGLFHGDSQRDGTSDVGPEVVGRRSLSMSLQIGLLYRGTLAEMKGVLCLLQSFIRIFSTIR